MMVSIKRFVERPFTLSDTIDHVLYGPPEQYRTWPSYFGLSWEADRDDLLQAEEVIAKNSKGRWVRLTDAYRRRIVEEGYTNYYLKLNFDALPEIDPQPHPLLDPYRDSIYGIVSKMEIDDPILELAGFSPRNPLNRVLQRCVLWITLEEEDDMIRLRKLSDRLITDIRLLKDIKKRKRRKRRLGGTRPQHEKIVRRLRSWRHRKDKMSYDTYEAFYKDACRTIANTTDVDLKDTTCLLYTSPSPRDRQKSRMPSSA